LQPAGRAARRPVASLVVAGAVVVAAQRVELFFQFRRLAEIFLLHGGVQLRHQRVDVRISGRAQHEAVQASRWRLESIYVGGVGHKQAPQATSHRLVDRCGCALSAAAARALGAAPGGAALKELAGGARSNRSRTPVSSHQSSSAIRGLSEE